MPDPGKNVSSQTYDDIQRVISSFSALMANPEIIELLGNNVDRDELGHIHININKQKAEPGNPDPRFKLESENLSDSDYLRGRLVSIEFFIRFLVRTVLIPRRADREFMFNESFPPEYVGDHSEDGHAYKKGYRDGFGSILAHLPATD